MPRFGSQDKEYSFKFKVPFRSSSIKKHETSHCNSLEFNNASTSSSFDQQPSPYSAPAFNGGLVKKREASNHMGMSNSFEYNKHDACDPMNCEYNRDPSPPMFDRSNSRKSSGDPSPPMFVRSNSRKSSRDPSPPTLGRSVSRRSNRTSFEQTSQASSPLDQSSPLIKSPWSTHMNDQSGYSYTGLMGSLVREEGSIYSLATSGDLLYTGSESKNIRVWKNQKEFSSFKSNSGLVKAIIIAGENIFTGHQDGKIRVWRVSSKNPNIHERVGTLPTMRAYLKCSMNPGNYVESGNNNRKYVWLKHFDAISSLSLSEDGTILYSASWDKTIKVWRVTDFKCLETINAHDDAVNSVVVGFDGLVFSGSADGSVKVWRREIQGNGTKHFYSQTLLKQEFAVTALSVDSISCNVYCGSSDGLVHFWETERRLSHGGILRGHKLAILCIATLRNLIFSGSADKNICVWKRDERNHICLSVLSGHTGPVKCLAVEQHKGGSGLDRQLMVYSGSLDRSVKIWRVSVQLPIQQYALADEISSMNNLHLRTSKNSGISHR